MATRRPLRKPKPEFNSDSSSYDQQAFNQAILSLQHKLHYEQEQQRELRQKLSSDLAQDRRLKEHRNQQRKAHAQYLLKQIELDQLKKKSQKLERAKIGISNDFHGYPDLPETPPQIRRRRELQRMKYLKQELDKQMKSSLQNLNEKKRVQRERELKHLDGVKKSLDLENQMKVNRKVKQKEMLEAIWKKAREKKKIENDIQAVERLGVIQRPNVAQLSPPSFSSNKVSEERQSLDFQPLRFSKEVNKAVEIGKMNQKIKTESRSGTLSPVQRKALVLREKIQRESRQAYQKRIQRMVQQAKSTRNLRSIPEKPSKSTRNFSISGFKQ